MTSFYMFRLWYMTFFGAQRFEEHATGHTHDDGHATHSHAVHESPWSMLAPLILLAILATVGGWIGIPHALGGGNHFEHFLDPVFTNGTNPFHSGTADDLLERILACVSVLEGVLGLFLADYYYRRRPDAAAKLARSVSGLHTALLHKYWIDELYAKVIVMPLFMISRYFLFYVVDKGVVEGSVATAAAGTRGAGSIFRRMQSGNIRSYAGWLAAGAAIVLAVTIFGRAVLVRF
jgi:NADH-quinone oxidoreductase subunit L